MSQEILVPEVSDGVTEGTVIALMVAVGDSVESDQTLLELETDKAVVAIPSPFDGKITEIRCAEGDIVAIGAVIMAGEPSGSGTEFGRAREEWLRYLQIEVPGPMSPGFRQAALDTAIVPPSRYIRLLRTLQRVFMNRPEPFDPGCPVLVLAGELDRTTTPEQAEEIARSTGGALLQRLPNCGHFSWAEDAGPTANAILDFFEGQQPKP